MEIIILQNKCLCRYLRERAGAKFALVWPVLVGLLEVLVRHRLLVCLARLALANLEKNKFRKCRKCLASQDFAKIKLLLWRIKNCKSTFFEELKNLLDQRFREPTACGTSVPATGCSSCRSAHTGEAGEEASRSETIPSRQNRRY